MKKGINLRVERAGPVPGELDEKYLALTGAPEWTGRLLCTRPGILLTGSVCSRRQ